MNRWKACRTTATLAALVALAAAAAVGGSSAINLGPIRPANPGFGESAQFSIFVTQDGRPVSKAKVEIWFSGRHGIQSPHWFARTNREGRATFTRRIPRDWKTKDTWVDLNASCDQVAARGMWRVRGK